jgi:hypothetical protein
MIRGMIVAGIWITVAVALAAPQRVLCAPSSSASGDAATQPSGAPVDPVIEEPIRPLFPDGIDDIAQARDCGSSEVLMMSSVAWLLLMLNVASNGRARRRT